jgi:hypothetical protein
MGVTSRDNHRIGAVVAFALVAGCGGGSKEPVDDRGNIILQNENNYTSTSMISVPTIETAPGVDLDICWTNLTEDLQCHPVVPATDIDNVSMLRVLGLSEPAIKQRLTGGGLAMSEVSGYVDYHIPDTATSTCMKMSQLSFFETPINVQREYVESTEDTYMMLFTKGTRPGVGARVMVFLKPTATSTNTRVDAPIGCGLLQFSADLASRTPVAVPAAGPWVVDWRDVTLDGQGNMVVYTRIDGLVLAFFEGKTPAQLQTEIFDIEINATTLWDLAVVGGRTADLAQAKVRGTGAPFTGFTTTGTGTWMLGLTCSTCQNPAPVLLSILNPVAGGS